MAKKIKLVLSGSGTRYPVHVGGIIRLVEDGCEITEICGTSGGAIIAAAIASGYDTGEESVKLMKSLLPSKHDLIDYSLWSLLFKWGLIKGEKLEHVFAKHFKPTFKDTDIPLHIVTTNVERKVARVFSSATDPVMSVARAVHASMAIPGVFAPVKIDNELYVDGGMTANYLLDIFGTGEDVIGFRFGAAHKIQSYTDAKREEIRNVKDYINANLDSMLEATTREHIEDAMFARTVTLKTKHGGLNFSMRDQEVDEMVQEGYDCVDKWLKKHPIKDSNEDQDKNSL